MKRIAATTLILFAGCGSLPGVGLTWEDPDWLTGQWEVSSGSGGTFCLKFERDTLVEWTADCQTPIVVEALGIPGELPKVSASDDSLGLLLDLYAPPQGSEPVLVWFHFQPLSDGTFAGTVNYVDPLSDADGTYAISMTRR